MAKIKKIVRSIFCIQITLFILLFDIVGVNLVGCCTAAVLNSEFGASTSYFDSPKYELSRDRDKVTLTSSRITTSYFGRQSRSTWKERIPLDPVPDGMMRCRLVVETDPEAPRLQWEMQVESLPLREGETLHLRIRPNDQHLLSQPFRVRLLPKNETEEVPADTDGQTGTPAPATADGPRLMFPVSCSLDGRSYELLTVAPADPRPNPYRKLLDEWERDYLERYKAGKAKREFPSYFSFCRSFLSEIGGSAPSLKQRDMLYQAAKEWDQREELRYYYPLREGQEEARMIEYERISGKRFPSFGATLWKAFLLPPAVVVDVALLPITVPASFYFYFGSMALAAAFQ